MFLCYNDTSITYILHALLFSPSAVRPPLPSMTRGKRPVRNPDDMMVIDSQGVTATQDELRATANARRRHKRRAKKEAKREAERRNSGKSLNRGL